MKIYVKSDAKKVINEKDKVVAVYNGDKRGHNYQAPAMKPNRNNGEDFDIAVREEMNRLEQKLQSMIGGAGDKSKQAADHSAYNNAYNNGQHPVPKSDLQIGFGNDPITERAIKKAKQIEYKRQLDEVGNNKKGNDNRTRNRSVTPPGNKGNRGKRDPQPMDINDRMDGNQAEQGRRRRNRSKSPGEPIGGAARLQNQNQPSQYNDQNRGLGPRRNSFNGNFEDNGGGGYDGQKPQYDQYNPNVRKSSIGGSGDGNKNGNGNGNGYNGYGDGNGYGNNGNNGYNDGYQNNNGNKGPYQGNGNGNNGNGNNGYDEPRDDYLYERQQPQYQQNGQNGQQNGNQNGGQNRQPGNGNNGNNGNNNGYNDGSASPRRASNDYNSSDRDEDKRRNNNNNNSNNPYDNQMKSPTIARVRLVNDMYGASSVIGEIGSNNIIPVAQWKPSVGQGDDIDRKRQAALDHKRGLDEQIMNDKKRKDDEKQRERQLEDNAMEKMLRQHDDDRERERQSQEALKIAMLAEERRQAENNDKFSEDAIARHSKNMKNKNTTPRKNMGKNPLVSPTSRIGNLQKSPSNQQMMGNQMLNNQKSPANANRTPTNANKFKSNLNMINNVNKNIEKNAALDYQRALDEQILEDRRRKQAEKEKEAADELDFMRAIRGNGGPTNNYDNEYDDNDNYKKNNYSYDHNNGSGDKYKSKLNSNDNNDNNNNNRQSSQYDSIDELKGNMRPISHLKRMKEQGFENIDENFIDIGEDNGRFMGDNKINNNGNYGSNGSNGSRRSSNGINNVNGNNGNNNGNNGNNGMKNTSKDGRIDSPLSRAINSSQPQHVQPQPVQTQPVYSSLASLASALGGGPELGAERSNFSHQNSFGANMRRAATPGGALECETQMTDSNTTLMFLQNPKSRENEQNNRFVQPPKDVNQFLEKYDHEINYERDFPNNKGRRKSQPTHPDYEQYEQYEQYEGARASEEGSGNGSVGRGTTYSRDEFDNDTSLSYAKERSAMRSASKRNITNSSGQNNGSKLNNIDTNDVSFVSDSKLLKMSPKKSLSTEQSMASESLLMYVGDNNSRMKSKVPTGTAKNSRPGTGGKKPEETPSTIIFSPAVEAPAIGKLDRRPSVILPVPAHTRAATPIITPRATSPRATSPDNAIDITTDSTPRETEELCQWCYGDYYPCRCAEKGRNTSILMKGNESNAPQLEINALNASDFTNNNLNNSQKLDDRRLLGTPNIIPNHLKDKNQDINFTLDSILNSSSKSKPKSKSNDSNNDGISVKSNKNNKNDKNNLSNNSNDYYNLNINFNNSLNTRKANIRDYITNIPHSGIPCKWCLGTFHPCFCEEGIPGMGDQADNSSSDYYEMDHDRNTNGTGGSSHVKRNSMMKKNNDDMNYTNDNDINMNNINNNRSNRNINISNNYDDNDDNSSISANTSITNTKKKMIGDVSKMTSFQKRLACFSADNLDNEIVKSYSYTNDPNSPMGGSSQSTQNGQILQNGKYGQYGQNGQNGVRGNQTRHTSIFASNGQIIRKTRNLSMNDSSGISQESARWKHAYGDGDDFGGM